MERDKIQSSSQSELQLSFKKLKVERKERKRREGRRVFYEGLKGEIF